MSTLRRWFRRLLPVLVLVVIVGALIFGASRVAAMLNARHEAEVRAVAYAQTATAVAPAATHAVASTATVILTETPTATETETATATASDTSAPTATPSATATATPAATDTPAITQAAMSFATNTPSFTPSFTPSSTPTATPTPSATSTPTSTPTATPVPSRTPFPTNTAVPTETPLPPPTATEVVLTATPRPLPTILLPPESTPRQPPVTAIPPQAPLANRRNYDIMNIVLLGNDGEVEPTDPSFRTDTMIILSINRTTGTANMLSLPRDLFVYIPGWTMQRLNLAYQHGELGGWTDGGFGLLRQTILYNFGIPTHYFVSVDFDGFQAIIDRLGGIDIAVDCAIQDYRFEGRDDWNEPIYRLYTLPVGLHHLDSDMALWYARSRRNSSDFDRGRRQMQLLLAIYREAKEQGLLGKALELWPEAEQIVQTNLTLPDIIGLLPIALNLDPSRIRSFNLIRTYHTTPWQTPDGSYVQLPNWEPIAQLIDNFYLPPTENQLVREGARIEVLNGSGNDGWGRVAAERLAWEGFVPIVNETYVPEAPVPQTQIIDFTGRTKGSSLQGIASALNASANNIVIQPDPTSGYDFRVIIGQDYNSCTFGVLPPEPTPTPSATPAS